VKIANLLEVLSTLDPDPEVFVPGYEGHRDTVDVVLVENALRVDVHERLWLGGFRAYEPWKRLGEPHVLIASARREEYAEGYGG
jgi:hypothetical protein